MYLSTQNMPVKRTDLAHKKPKIYIKNMHFKIKNKIFLEAHQPQTCLYSIGILSYGRAVRYIITY